jgi:hypothetical protein
MRFVAVILAVIAIAAAIAIGRAPAPDEVAALNAAQGEAVERYKRLSGMTREFIQKAYPEDPLLYCWARSTDCRAQTEAWRAVVDDMRAQYREAVVRDFPDLKPQVERAEARLVERVAEIARLHAQVPVADRVKTYYLSRDAASEGFEFYRTLPVEPRIGEMRTKTASVLSEVRQKLGF